MATLSWGAILSVLYMLWCCNVETSFVRDASRDNTDSRECKVKGIEAANYLNRANPLINGDGKEGARLQQCPSVIMSPPLPHPPSRAQDSVTANDTVVGRDWIRPTCFPECLAPLISRYRLNW